VGIKELARWGGGSTRRPAGRIRHPVLNPQPGWQPDPSWPPAPPGWQVWVWVDDVPLWWDQTVASSPSLDEPPLPARGGARVTPGRSETDYLTPTSAGPQQARADQRGSLVATAVTSVCLAYFTNATTALMGRNTLIWAAFITIGGLGIGLLFRFVLTPARGRALAAKLGKRQQIPHSLPSSSFGISDTGGHASPVYRSRRFTRVFAAIAAVLLLGAFVLLQLSLSVTLVTVGILASLVGITFLLSGRIFAGAHQVIFNVGNSVVCITLTLGSLAVANGILNPGALAGAWRSTSWVVVRDDPHAINWRDPSAWELAAKNGCLGNAATSLHRREMQQAKLSSARSC
jgi:hypothetical protein